MATFAQQSLLPTSDEKGMEEVESIRCHNFEGLETLYIVTNNHSSNALIFNRQSYEYLALLFIIISEQNLISF